MAKNYLDKWEEEDEEFKPNERLAEVLQLVKKGTNTNTYTKTQYSL